MRSPVTLPLHCTSCGGAIRLTYEPDGSSNSKTSGYTCPHCRGQIAIQLPGPVLKVIGRVERR